MLASSMGGLHSAGLVQPTCSDTAPVVGMGTECCVDALQNVMDQCGPSDIFNTDHIQHLPERADTSEAFSDELATPGVDISYR
jgi:hypothetical protein